MIIFEPGEIINAVVVRIEHYGAWIECEGRLGLINIPEISWSRIRHPSDVLSSAQRIQAKIFRDDGEKYTASIRNVHPELNPWHDPSTFAPGKTFAGSVNLVTDYGAFVELEPEVSGLLRREKWPKELIVGDRVRVLVESIDVEKHKIEVSLLDVTARASQVVGFQ